MKLKRLLVVAAASVAVLVAAGWVLLFQPFRGESAGASVLVVIPKGAGLSQVADLLESTGVVDSGLLFKLRARISGDAGRLHAGPIRMRRDMSYDEALRILTEEGNATRIVTIPEGLSRQEVAPILRGQGVKGDYTGLTRSSDLLDPADYGAPSGTSLDGFLYPSTYDLNLPPRAAELVALQIAAFKREFATVDLRRAKAKNLTAWDVIKIASMVERETAVAEERPLVAAVIWNRLRDGIPLGVDATTRYQFSNWTRPLRQSELASDSPWNTRRNAGLPPGPIGNPGLAAIRAAANPASSDDLYYVVKPWTCGRHQFARTQAEFDRAVAAYNSARESNGGRAPTKCP